MRFILDGGCFGHVRYDIPFSLFYPNEVECNSLLELLFPETLIVNGLGVHGT